MAAPKKTQAKAKGEAPKVEEAPVVEEAPEVEAVEETVEEVAPEPEPVVEETPVEEAPAPVVARDNSGEIEAVELSIAKLKAKVEDLEARLAELKS